MVLLETSSSSGISEVSSYEVAVVLITGLRLMDDRTYDLGLVLPDVFSSSENDVGRRCGCDSALQFGSSETHQHSG